MINTTEALRLGRAKRSLTVPNWPAADQRVTARFSVRGTKSGLQRAVRVTTGQPRQSPTAKRVGIATGSDGKTYIVGERSNGQRFIMAGTMRLLLWIEPGQELYAEIGDSLNG